MARIVHHTTVERDGRHNAFTDMVHWRGAYWCSYRKGSAHVSPDSEAVLSVSQDRERWSIASRVHVPGDNRDPKLIPMPDGRLAMLVASWQDPFSPEGKFQQTKLLQYILFTEDGYNWSAPTVILEPNRWLWRVRYHNGRYYGGSYGSTWGSEGVRSIRYEFLVSDDLLSWTCLSTVGYDGGEMGESDFIFDDDGVCRIVGRNGIGDKHSRLAIAAAPYTDWTVKTLGVTIHSPAIIRHEGVLYVAGRHFPEATGVQGHAFLSPATLGIWRLTDDGVELVMHIPATGDCSYPGFIIDPCGRICISYYSQHAYDMGVIPYTYRRDTENPWATGTLVAKDDIYFAEITLP